MWLDSSVANRPPTEAEQGPVSPHFPCCTACTPTVNFERNFTAVLCHSSQPEPALRFCKLPTSCGSVESTRVTMQEPGPVHAKTEHKDSSELEDGRILEPADKPGHHAQPNLLGAQDTSSWSRWAHPVYEASWGSLTPLTDNNEYLPSSHQVSISSRLTGSTMGAATMQEEIWRPGCLIGRDEECGTFQFASVTRRGLLQTGLLFAHLS